MIAVLASLVVALTVPSAQPPVPPGPPVRIWLEPAGALAPGDQARVYVQTSGDGNLIVLLSQVDGSVTMLFPRDPSGDPFVRAGTYEIVGPRDRPAVSAEDLGRGVVLAAVSPDPVWFDEFTAGRGWNNSALTGAGAGTDPEGVLTDVVQRMLGDGSFNYDVATYYVTPPPTVSYAPEPPVFNDCFGCDYAQPAVGYVEFAGGILANPVNYNCRYLHACSPGFRPLPSDIRDVPTVVSVPFPPQHGLALYSRGQLSGVVAPPPMVARSRSQVPARDPVATRPRSRTMPVEAATPQTRARAFRAAAPNPEPLAARARPRSEVVNVAVARQRVLERQPRPVRAQSPNATLGATRGGVTAGLAVNPPRDRGSVPMGLMAAPAAAPVMMRAPLAEAPVNVRPVRTTAGMGAVSGMPMAGAAPTVAQTIAVPHIPPRLRVGR
ncbi:MAG TPA: DUF4384 domain-containing protein [Gemmatimonadales bacterium]|nr:DUF4384 domain-containing protein [Gemmatimonadales bacterium]